MVAWEHAYPGPCCDWDMRGQEYDMLGMPVGVEIRISQSADDETNVRVAARPGKKRDFMAVWQKETTIGTEIWAERWGDVQVPYEYFQVASAAWWAHTRPEVMIAGPRYYFVYEADSLGDPTVFRHIFARGWTANVTYVPLLLR